MGYRSEVRIAVYGPEPLTVQAHVAKWKGSLSAEALAVVADGEVHGPAAQFDDATGTTVYRLEFDNIKWYGPSCPVKEITDIFAGIDGSECISGEYLRLGERDADMEREDYGAGCLYRYQVSRTIVFE